MKRPGEELPASELTAPWGSYPVWPGGVPMDDNAHDPDDDDDDDELDDEDEDGDDDELEEEDDDGDDDELEDDED